MGETIHFDEENHMIFHKGTVLEHIETGVKLLQERDGRISYSLEHHALKYKEGEGVDSVEQPEHMESWSRR